MAKKETTKSIWDDYSEEALLDQIPDEQEEEETEEEETDEQEGEPSDKKKKKTSKKAESEEEEETEEETEEEEEEKPIKKKSTKTSKKKEEEEEETEEEESEDDEKDKVSRTEDEVDAETFFEEVNKLTGQDVEVDYGDVDPLTPQGIAIRERAVREDALEGFLNDIETNYPRVFQALKHAHNGGDVTELFAQSTTRDYSTVEIGDKDESLAKEILKEYYKSKGIKNEAKIAKMIENDEDAESGLIGEAKSALEEMKKEQETSRNKVLEAQEQKAKEDKKRDQVFVTAVDEVLKERQLGSFKLTDKSEAAAFRQYVFKNIRKTPDGKYELATIVDGSNLEKALQYQYFQFKKGDLSKIIQQKAATQNTEKLRLKLKAEETKIKKSSKEERSTPKYGTMKDFEVDE